MSTEYTKATLNLSFFKSMMNTQLHTLKIYWKQTMKIYIEI